MRIAEIMSRDVRSIRPDDTVERAARLMAERDLSFLPVAEERRLVGTINDRDIVLRVVAPGFEASTLSVRQAMTADPATCREDEMSDEVLVRMQALYARRLAVLDRDGRLVGVVSRSDFVGDGKEV